MYLIIAGPKSAISENHLWPPANLHHVFAGEMVILNLALLYNGGVVRSPDDSDDEDVFTFGAGYAQKRG